MFLYKEKEVNKMGQFYIWIIFTFQLLQMISDFSSHCLNSSLTLFTYHSLELDLT